MTRATTAALGVILALAGARAAWAFILGGGPKKSDCLAIVSHVDATSTKKPTVVDCTDGDPACDSDNQCDDTCTFRVNVCVGQSTATCTAGTVTRLRVKGAQLTLPPLPASAGACGADSTFTLKPKKGRKPGIRRIRLAARTGKRGGDKDAVTFLCRRRTGECPPTGETKLHDVLPLPPVSVDPPSPLGGTAATATASVASASSLTLTAAGEGCGGFTTKTVSGSSLVDTETVGGFGACTLTVVGTTPSGPETVMGRFVVVPTALNLPAAQLAGGTFLPGALPDPDAMHPGPQIGSATAPGSLITGGTATLRLTLMDPAQASKVKSVQLAVSGAGGDTGYFEAPATVDGNDVVVNVAYGPAGSAFQAADATSGVDVLAQLVDALGQVGNRIGQHFGLLSVGTGGVQVSLSWDTPTDVDLHVVEPGGEEIFWAHRASATNGMLDLDSNAGCGIDGVNNENITWSDVPPPGEYTVRVDFWSDCAVPPDTPGLPANWTVTTNVCQETKTFSGSFAAGTSDMGASGAGVTVTTFKANCTARVRGKATFEKFPLTTGGLSATGSMVPIPFAKIAVLRESDGATLAEDATKQDGTFDLRFQNDQDPGVRVVVMAEATTPVDQNVKDNTGAIYAAKSDVINERMTPDVTDLKIEVKRAQGAGAWNIWNVGIQGATFVRSVTGKDAPHLNWLWTSGAKGSCSGFVSCFSRGSSLISVLSDPSDTDEFDDPVLLHEYGHFFMANFSRDDSPGGPHTATGQFNPLLAWSEGAATAFGQSVLGGSLYLDSNAGGIGVRADIETLDTSVPRGTVGNTLTGNLNEFLVSSILWDLEDATNETKDTLANRDAVFKGFQYLGGGTFADRGVAKADLVDLLDGWFCNGYDNKGDATSGVQGIVVGLGQFPYDFPTLPPC